MLHRKPRFIDGLTVSLIVAVVVAAAPAQQQQQQQPPPQERPTFRARANFVRVDVFPTKEGKPVLDLRQEEFELFEDNAAQAINTFEQVRIERAGPQAIRTEPSTIEASRQLAANPRNRVFVVFLDVGQVSLVSSNIIRQPIINMIERLVGADDLVGIMTPAMSVSDLTLGRKTDVITRGLRDSWFWGERGQSYLLDDREREYDACYPKRADDGGPASDPRSGTARAMIERRRERMALDALGGLVAHLWGLREERKAVITISEGWRLFRPDDSLTKLRKGDPMPGTEPITTGPDGRLGRRSPTASGPIDRVTCDGDRMQLAMMDNEKYFRDIIGDANRANVSFYAVDPRGLAVQDDPTAVIRDRLNPEADFANLRARTDTLRTLAEATDGVAALSSNDLNASFRRVTDDLSSYYLLGYYSTNTKLDGTYRTIKVRVKRPGVDIRARRGYRAATEEEIAAARSSAGAAAPPSPVANAMNELSRLHPAVRFRIAASPLPGATGVDKIWVVGELLGSEAATSIERQVDIQVSGGAAGSMKVPLTPPSRTFSVAVPLTAPAKGLVEVRARVSGDVIPLTDTAHVEGMAPVLYRRGPATGNRLVPVAAPQFSRTERLRLEIPAGAEATLAAGRVLNRTSQPLEVPVVLGERTDTATGQRWLTADVPLASLGVGDYVVELALSGDQRFLTAIRVGR